MLSSALPGPGSLLPPPVRPIPLSSGPHCSDDSCWPGTHTHAWAWDLSSVLHPPGGAPSVPAPPLHPVQPPGWSVAPLGVLACPVPSGLRLLSRFPTTPCSRPQGTGPSPSPGPGQKAALPQSCRARLGNHLWPPGPALTNPFCILGPGRVLSLEGAPGPFFLRLPRPGDAGGCREV